MQDAGRGVREESARSCCGAEACGEVPIPICFACRVRYTETMTVHLSVTRAEWYMHGVCVSVAHMVVAHVWTARTWAARADGAEVSVIALGSARGCATGGTRVHASGRDMGLVMGVPLGLIYSASEAR